MLLNRTFFAAGILVLSLCLGALSQTTNINLADVRMRDVCILADEATKTYYAISSTMAATVESGRRPSLRAYTSKDLRTWDGPHIVWQTPNNFWGDINIKAIWAPELHAYKGKHIWSSFGKGGFTVGVAVSTTGKLRGPWEQS